MKTCPHCGNSNPDTHAFCDSCGHSLAANRFRAKKTIFTLAAMVIIVAAVAAVSFFAVSGRGVALSQQRRQIEKAAADDNELFKAQKYARIYQGLANADRKQVSQAEWIKRSKAVEGFAGKLKDYRVISVKSLTKAKSVVIVEIEANFSKLKKPAHTSMFYKRENGRWRQSMLWGQTLRPMIEELK